MSEPNPNDTVPFHGIDVHRIMAESSEDWVFWIGTDRRVKYSSPSARRVSGYTAEEIIGDPDLIERMVVDEDRDFFRMQRGQQGEPAQHDFRMRIRTREGEIRWIQHLCHPIYDEEGTYIGQYVTHRDISRTVFQEHLYEIMYSISELTSRMEDVAQLFSEIKGLLETLMPVPNFYIARFDRASDTISFPYVIDTHDKQTLKTRKTMNGLTEYVLRTGKTLLADTVMLDSLIATGEVGIVGSRPETWLGTPLCHGEETFGVLAVQSYDESIRYTEKDAEIINFVAHHIAQAIIRWESMQRIRVAEEKFQKAFRASPEAMAITRLDNGIILDVNGSFERMFGYTRDEMIGRTTVDLGLWQSDRDRSRLTDVLIRRQSARDMEFCFGTPPRPVSQGVISAEVIEIEGEQYVLSMIRDVTRQKEAEQKLRIKEDLLSRMLDVLPVGVFLTDEEGRIFRANPAAYRIWAGAQFVGPGQYGVYKGWRLADHTPIMPEEWAAFRAIRNGETTLDEEIEIECFDGNRRIIRNSALPLRDDRGRILGSIIVNLDISDLKRVQTELRASNEFLQSLLDAIPNPLFNKNANGSFIGCNRAFELFYGFTRSEIIGKTSFQMFPRSEAEFHVEMDRHLLDKPGSLSYESKMRHADGTQHDVIVSKATYPSSDGTPAGIIGVLIDITERKTAETALKKSEENLRALLQSTLQGFILFDRDLQVVTFNPVAAHWAQTIYGKTLMEGAGVGQIMPLKAQAFLQPVLEAALNDSPQLFTRHFEVGNGEDYWFDFNILPVKDALGEITGICVSIIDNTELEKALLRVRHLSSALEQSAIMIFILNLEGRIEFINRQVETKTGYSESDLMGRSMSLFYFDEPEWMIEMVRSVHSTARDLHTETLVQPKHGDPFWVSITVSPIRNQDGLITHFLVQEEDISERKLREDSLNQSESKYRELFETAPYGIIILDTLYTVVDVNLTTTRMLGYEKQETFGRDLGEWTAENDTDKYHAMLDTMANEGVSHAEIAFLRKDGITCWVELTASQILDETGSMSGVIIHCLDISARRQIEVQLRHAQKMESIGQLAAGIAHEINTPTQFVGDNLRFLSESFNDLHKLIMAYHEAIVYARDNFENATFADEVTAYEEEIDLDFILSDIPQAFTEANDGLARISKIVKAMKEFSHPEVDRKNPTDLNHAIESTITVARNEWKYVADMKLDLDPDLPMVPCLPGEFNQVILNLVINAAHAIEEAKEKRGDREKGSIAISTGIVDDMAVVRIKDSGTGIPKEIHGRIFDPFFTTKRVGKGTGQGLAISHSVIVEKHGGRLHFETEEGAGTTFIIELPLNGFADRPAETEEDHGTIG